jgi:hypothetical protein
MKRRILKHLFRIALGFACPLMASAQSIPVSVSAGGGGTSASGAFEVKGTVGQPSAVVSVSGPYAVRGGFWSQVQVLQTPGAPVLRLVQEFGLVKLRWAKGTPGFLLETTTTVGNPASWTTTGGSPVENGADFEVAQPPPAGVRFFRLRRP